MNSQLTPAARAFLLDWTLALAVGGILVALLGLVVGWIIWRNARRLTMLVEEGNRSALAVYEQRSEDVSRIKSELASGGR